MIDSNGGSARSLSEDKDSCRRNAKGSFGGKEACMREQRE